MGCGFFDDPTPDNVELRLDGPAGSSVQLVMAKNFLAGVNETGTTEVEVFTSDMVDVVLPFDTVVNISVERRFFFQIVPRSADTLAVSVRIDIDGRSLYNQSGNVFSANPFRWVYMFNTPTTLVIELI